MDHPIFITGLSRTGKTILSAMLNRHPNCMVPHFRVPFGRSHQHQFGELNVSSLDRYIQSLFSFSGEHEGLSLRKNLSEYLTREKPSYKGVYEVFMNALSREKGKHRWGVQIPIWNVADAVEAFSGARIIHLIRDPRDRYADRLTDRADRLKRSWLTLAREITIWRTGMQTATRHQREYSETILICRYEDLAGNPEQTLRLVCDFVGEGPVPVHDLIPGMEGSWGKGSRIRYGPLSEEHVGIYRTILDDLEVEMIERLTKIEMARHRYVPAKGSADPHFMRSMRRMLCQSFCLGYSFLFGLVRLLRSPEKRLPEKFRESIE